MPANEQTWRNQVRLHLIFGASGLLLLLSTLWMYAADHDRSWKSYQRKARNADVRQAEWQKHQFETDEYQHQLHEFQANLADAQGRGFDSALINKFKNDVSTFYEKTFGSAPNFNTLDQRSQRLNEAATKADAARAAFSAAWWAAKHAQSCRPSRCDARACSRSCAACFNQSRERPGMARC